MTDTPFAPTVQTQSDLQEVWRRLMGPWGFDGHSIWMMLIVDDKPLPQLTEITGSEEPLEARHLGGLVELLRMLDQGVASGARFAFLRSRPGPDVITENDRAWAACLYAAARSAAVPCEVVHLATRRAVRPIPPDDIGVQAKAG